jgi:hypothetical protein
MVKQLLLHDDGPADSDVLSAGLGHHNRGPPIRRRMAGRAPGSRRLAGRTRHRPVRGNRHRGRLGRRWRAPAQEPLACGQNVIVESGPWLRGDRDERWLAAHQLGRAVGLAFLQVPFDELSARCANREGFGTAPNDPELLHRYRALRTTRSGRNRRFSIPAPHRPLRTLTGRRMVWTFPTTPSWSPGGRSGFGRARAEELDRLGSTVITRGRRPDRTGAEHPRTITERRDGPMTFAAGRRPRGGRGVHPAFAKPSGPIGALIREQRTATMPNARFVVGQARRRRSRDHGRRYRPRPGQPHRDGRAEQPLPGAPVGRGAVVASADGDAWFRLFCGGN